MRVMVTVRDELVDGETHVFDPVPRNHVTLVIRRPKHGRPQLCIALGLEIGERRAASHRVEHKAKGLLQCQCAVHLAEAVCVARTQQRT